MRVMSCAVRKWAALAWIVATVPLFPGARAQEGRSQWDGVYSAEQAKRGQALYEQHCASCHGSELAGGEMAPPLTGAQFTNTWDQLTLGDLLDRIRLTMPPADPNTVTRAQKVDILAHMLSAGGYPAGQTDLAPQSDALRAIVFRATKP